MGEKFPAKAADNWDLQAVVRCFSSANSTAANYTPQVNSTTTSGVAAGAATVADESSLEDPLAFLATMKFDEDDDPFSFPNLFENKNIGFQELEDSYKPFYSTPSSAPEGLINHQQQQQQLQLNSSIVSPMNSSSFPPFVIGEQNNQQTRYVQQPLQQQDPQIHQQQQQQQLPMRLSSAIPLRPTMPSHAHRTRKRKSPIKKMVCQVTEEKLSADLWAWRKYGQKPIKGSPYPRNYYRCSSSKGCAARKQVERSNTDPNIYIVSYTGDHTHPRPTHRNSLAGSTRNKFSGTQNHPVSTTPPPPPPLPPPTSSSSPLSAACQSPSAPTTPAVDEEMSSIENILANEADHEKDTNKTLMEEEEEEEDDDDDDDLFEDLLIPNLAAPGIDEDFFKGLKQFGTSAASGGGDNDV